MPEGSRGVGHLQRGQGGDKVKGFKNLHMVCRLMDKLITRGAEKFFRGAKSVKIY